MALNPDFMFEKAYITQPLRRALGLPEDVWYVVLNDSLDSAYYMDARFRVHNKAIKPEARPVVELASQRRREAVASLPATASYRRQPGRQLADA